MPREDLGNVLHWGYIALLISHCRLRRRRGATSTGECSSAPGYF